MADQSEDVDIARIEYNLSLALAQRLANHAAALELLRAREQDNSEEPGLLD